MLLSCLPTHDVASTRIINKFDGYTYISSSLADHSKALTTAKLCNHLATLQSHPPCQLQDREATCAGTQALDCVINMPSDTVDL
jgi:hypothetical protein